MAQDDALDLLCLALPYVEEAERDPAYKPGVVKQLSARIRRLFDSGIDNPDAHSPPSQGQRFTRSQNPPAAADDVARDA